MQIDYKQLKKIKLVVFDLDGTILTDEGFIGEKTISLVKKLQNEHGVFFSIASGRLHSAVIDYCSQIGINIPVITMDGSLIKKTNNEKPIFRAYIKEKHVKKTIELAEKHLIKVVIGHADRVYYTENNEPILHMTNKFGADFVPVNTYQDNLGDVLEIFCAGENHSYIRYLAGKLSFPYSFGLNCNYHKSLSYKGVYYLEIRKKGCTKKTGLLKLLRYLNISQRHCAVLGDWYNDRPLFESKALKIAVANAVPEIKYLADYVTENDNNNDATGEFLEMLLKAKTGK